MERAITYFIVLCCVSLLNALPPKTIDGNSNDWSYTELFNGGDSSQWGISWDSNNLYFAIFSIELNNEINTRSVNFFIDTDPEMQPSSGTGTMVGNTYNTQTPRPSFTANYFVEWRLNNTSARLFNYGSSWTVVPSTIRQFKSGNFIEFAVPLSNISNPSGIYVCGCVVDERALYELALLSFPKTFSVSYQSNISWGAYYGFPLLTSNIPPTLMDIGYNEVNLNAFPAQTINSGFWGSSSSWARGKIANYQSNAYVTRNAVVSATDIECRNLIIESGSNVTHNGDLELKSNSAYILNYGAFTTNGQVNPAIGLSTNGTVSSFYDVYLRGPSRIANSTIRHLLTLYQSSYIDDDGPIFYATNSELVYANTDSFARSREWLSNSGAAAPYHVRVTANTLVYFANSAYSLNVGVLPGTLTVESGSTFSGEGAISLTVTDLVNQGTISLGVTGIFNLYVTGSFSNTGTVSCNSPSRTVWVNGLRFNRPTIIQTPGQGYFNLSLPNTFLNYRWSTLETTPFILVSQNGTYHVNVTDSNGCFATSNYLVVLITPNNTLPVTSGSNGMTSGGSNLQSDLQTSASNKSTLPIIVGAAVGGVVLIIVLILAVVCLARRNKKRDSRHSLKDMGNKQQIYSNTKPEETDYKPLSAPTPQGSTGSIVGLMRTSVSTSKTYSWEISYSELKIKSEIASGHFGVVYLGRWRNADVAVKQIRRDKVTDALIENFKMEVELISALRPHVNVVQFLAACVEPFCIVTELLPNGNLYKYLRDHADTITLTQRLGWLKGTAAGMRHLQAENIVHRDLATRNVLLSSDLTAKIGDFGMSRLIEPESGATTQSSLGPVKWMAPESLWEREYSTLTDVWSFGVVIYEIYCASDPYGEMSAEEVVSKMAVKQLKLEIPDSVDIQDAVKSLFKQCLDHDKTKRPDFTVICEKLGLE